MCVLLRLQVQSVFEGSEDVLLTSEERFTQGQQLLDLIADIHSAVHGNCNAPLLSADKSMIRLAADGL